MSSTLHEPSIRPCCSGSEVCTVDHPLAAQDEIRLSSLAGEPLLIAPRRIGPGIYDRIIALFRAQGITPHIVQEVTPMTTLVGLVSAGAGMGLVTEGISRLPRPGVVFRPVTPAPPPLPMAASWLKPDLSASGRRFLEIVSALGRD